MNRFSHRPAVRAFRRGACRLPAAVLATMTLGLSGLSIANVHAVPSGNEAVPDIPPSRAPRERQAPHVLAPEPAPELLTPPHDASVDLPEREDVARVTPAMAAMYDAMLEVEYERYEEAIPKLEWVIEEDPSLQGAWTALGWAYWASGRTNEARALSEHFLDLAPHSARAHTFRAQMATQDDDLDLAIRMYRKSLAIDPDQPGVRYHYARVLLWSGRPEEAAQALQELRVLHEEDPERLDIEIQLARALFANEAYEEALDVWSGINERFPDIPEYKLWLARCLAIVGALREAQAEAEEILRLEPDHEGALQLLLETAMQLTDPSLALAALQRIERLADSDEARAQVVLQRAHYMWSMREIHPDLFSINECLEAARKAHELDPGRIESHLFYAELLLLNKRYERAERLFREVLEHRNPHNLRARKGLFEVYMGRRMYAEAEAQLEDNLAGFNPHDPYRHHAWALLHAARGRYREAMHALDQLEREGAEGAVFTLLYHGLSPSEWTAMPSVRQFRDHLMTLRREGYRFLHVEELPEYFANREPLAPEEHKPWLYRFVQRVRYALTGRDHPEAPPLRAYTPERVACVTFDDGLRSSFRWATPVAEELNLPLSMFVLPSFIRNRDHRIVTFPELRAYHETGLWTIGSHLMDAHYYDQPIGPEGQKGLPLPNRLWFEKEARQETYREYYRRVRHEFKASKAILQRELDLPPDGISSVAYPLGDIGQYTDSNIRLFNVPKMILNEAALHYRLGFLQDRAGHAMKRDHPLLLKRWEPSRHHTGQDVLRHALKNHPVFLARRTRAELAALQGDMHAALDMLELLKRDAYPEEDLAELSAYIHRRLARLTPMPAAVQDDGDSRTFGLRHPFLGIEGHARKANVMIDDWLLAVKGGVHIHPRLNLEARVGTGRIRQEVVTDVWTQPAGLTTPQQRVVTSSRFTAGEEMAGLALQYVFPDGSAGSLDARYRAFDKNLEGESAFVAAADYVWRPTLAIDLSMRYEHDLVPSARQLIKYDGALVGAAWRIQDGWHATGNAAYWMFDEGNSLLRMVLEHFLRVSPRHDLWLGFHHSVVTTDMESDLYWTPYWDARHLLVLRVRRRGQGYYGMLRANLGLQRARGRPEEWERYRGRRVLGAAQGWYPGEAPDESWNGVIGVTASLHRRWAAGWELQGNVSVNSIGDHTERILRGSLLYRF